MPITVDHEQRRREVAEVAAELIAHRGLERVTVREIAAATGFSTTVVSIDMPAVTTSCGQRFAAPLVIVCGGADF